MARRGGNDQNDVVGFAITGNNDGLIASIEGGTKKANKAGQTMAKDMGKSFQKVETASKRAGTTLGQRIKAGADRAARATVDMAEKASAAVLAMGAAFGQVAENVAGTVDEVGTLSALSGLSADTINGLRLQAERTNKALTDIVPKDLPKRLLETSANTGEALRGFAALEIDVLDAAGALRTADDVLPEVLDKLARVENPTTKAALAVQILGAEGQQMLSAFEDSAGLRGVVEDARRFGVEVGPEAVAASNAWFRATSNLSRSWEEAQQALFDTFGPAATQFLNNFALGFFRIATVAEEVVNVLMGQQSLSEAFKNADERAFEFWTTLNDGAGESERVAKPAIEGIRDVYTDVGIRARQAAIAVKETTKESVDHETEFARFRLKAHEETRRMEAERRADIQERREAEREAAKEALELEKQRRMEAAIGWAEVASTVASTIGALTQLHLDSTLELANATIDAARNSAHMSEEAILELAQTQQDQVVKAWRLNQAAQYSSAIIDAARAGVAMLPAFAFAGPLAPVLAAGTAAAALGIQLATIAAQSPPRVNYPTGGIVGPVMPDHTLIAAQPGEGINNLRAMADPAFRRHMHDANRGVRTRDDATRVEVVVSYSRSARRLVIEPRRRSVGKRMSSRRR